MNAQTDLSRPVALRVRFPAASGLPSGSRFDRHALAPPIIEELATDILLEGLATATADDVLDVIVLPSGQAELLPLQRTVETWIAQPSAGKHASAPIELVFRGDRICWRPDRAMVIVAGTRREEVVAGLVGFARNELELRRLESETSEKLNAAAGDVDLTHAVVRASLSRQARVNAITVWAAQARIRFTLLEPTVASGAAALPPPSLRLARELAVQSEVVERLRVLDDQLEVVAAIYELANDRLTEYSYFLREYRLERWILLALVAELAFSIIGLFV